MARPENQVREEFLNLALELVNDRFAKEVAKRQNDALLTQGSGNYILPPDNRATEARRIARDWYTFYSEYGGDVMVNAIKQAYELADQTYQDDVENRIFNAIKYTDSTETEVLSRVAYVLPTDRREVETVTNALENWKLMQTG